MVPSCVKRARSERFSFFLVTHGRVMGEKTECMKKARVGEIKLWLDMTRT